MPSPKNRLNEKVDFGVEKKFGVENNRLNEKVDLGYPHKSTK